MSTSLEGLEMTFRSLLSSEPWLHDPAVVPIPWRQDIVDVTNQRLASRSTTDYRPLKCGILWNDGVVEPHPPVRRGLSTVVDAVRNAGHTVVDWSPPKQTTAKRVHVSFLLADGAHDVHTQLRRSGEPLIPELKKSFQLRDPMPLLEYQDLTLQGLDYEREYCDYWNSTSRDGGKIWSYANTLGRAYTILGTMVDAVIMPVAPHAAVIPGKYYHTG